MAKIDVSGVYVTVVKLGSEDYISLTDMMRSKDGEFFFHNWLRNRNTVEFLGTWEKVFNPEFNSAEFDIIKSKAGLNNFRLSVKEWTEKTRAIGIVSKADWLISRFYPIKPIHSSRFYQNCRDFSSRFC